MKNAGSERAIDTGDIEYLTEVFDLTCAARCDQRHGADGAYGGQLFEIVPALNAILIHAIEDDLTCPTQLHFTYPGQRSARGGSASLRITGVLMDLVPVSARQTVDPDYYALGAEAFDQKVDQIRVLERRGVDRNLVSTQIENAFGIRDGADAARNAEWNIEHRCHPVDPAPIDHPTAGARRDVVEHELVRAFVAVALRQLQNAAHHAVIAKLDALDDDAVPDIEAGDYSLGKNRCISWSVMRPSRRALPAIAAATPVSASACRSSKPLTPPEACQAICG